MQILSRALLAPLLSCILHAGIAVAEPVNVILDTDMSGDCDDAGALAMLHELQNRGECELLAVVVSERNPASVPCIDAINTYYGRPDIPVGIRPDYKKEPSGYPETLAREFPHDMTVENAERADTLYRRILGSQPDRSVTIVTIGFLTNLAALLDSPPDAFSPLDGERLVAKKVRELSCMGGQFRGDIKAEYNFRVDPESTQRVIQDWPTPVMFSGFEIGVTINTGAGFASAPAENPVRRAYEVYLDGLGKSRSSWDQTAVLYAVRGLDDYWDAQTQGHATFDLVTRKTGWVRKTDPEGRLEQGFLIPEMDSAQLEQVIEELMAGSPQQE